MTKLTYRQRLVQRIDAYCALHGIDDWAFGRLAAFDGALVGRLRDPRVRIAVSTVERAEHVLRAPPARHVRRRKPRRAAAPNAAC